MNLTCIMNIKLLFSFCFHFFLKQSVSQNNLHVPNFLSGNAFLLHYNCPNKLYFTILVMIIAYVGDWCLQTKAVNQLCYMTFLCSNISYIRGKCPNTLISSQCWTVNQACEDTDVGRYCVICSTV